MNGEKIIMLENYIKLKMSPILLEDITIELFKNAVILEADCDDSLLAGHYEDINFVPPEWYNELLSKNNSEHSLLLIPNINKISLEEQLKFVELFKYKKINTFKLPEQTIILATATNLKENPIAEPIYSLMIHI